MVFSYISTESGTIALMNKLNQRGMMNSMVIPVIGLSIVALALLGMVIYLGAQLDEAENGRDEFAATAVKEARSDIESDLQAKFTEKEKEPFTDFETDTVLGGINLKYPKTWSVSMLQDTNDDPQIDAYFHPEVIRIDNEDTRSYAMRLQLVVDPYSEVLEDFSSDIEDGLIKTKAVTFNGIEGVRLDGQLDEVDRGAMIILPLRDKTIMVWTESRDFLSDFEKVMTSFSFNP